MKTLLITAPEAKSKPKTRELVLEKLAGWQIEALPAGSFDEAATVPDVTLVQISDATRPAQVKAIIPRLARMQSKAKKGAYVLFSFKEHLNAKPRAAQKQKRSFSAMVGEI